MSDVGFPLATGRVQETRGLRVMLDMDLAALYGVHAKRLNKQVKRNRDRFPSDFLFQLTLNEKAEVVANCDHLQNLSTPPEPGKRPIGLLTHEDKKDIQGQQLERRKEGPVNALLKGGDYHPGADAIQVMTMKVSKGLEFAVVALPGVGHMPAPGEDGKEAARTGVRLIVFQTLAYFGVRK